MKNKEIITKELATQVNMPEPESDNTSSHNTTDNNSNNSELLIVETQKTSNN